MVDVIINGVTQFSTNKYTPLFRGMALRHTNIIFPAQWDNLPENYQVKTDKDKLLTKTRHLQAVL